MRALVLEKPGTSNFTEVPDPTPGPGEVIVAVDACGICGTDLHIYDGEFAPTPYPIIPGHEFCGTVVAVGDDVEGFKALEGLEDGVFVAVDPSLYCGVCRQCRRGRGNLCERWGAIGDTVDGAFAEFVRVPAANAYVLPPELPRSWGTIVEPLSCAVHAMDRISVQPGDEVLLYGAGTMGLLLGSLLRKSGAARVDVVDRNADRLPLAEKLIATATATSADELDHGDWDLVVDATGAIPAIEDGLGRVRRGGTFLVFGVAASDVTARFSPFGVYNDEVTIVGSMAVLNSFGRAVDLLAGGVIDAGELITARLPLAQYDDAIAGVRAGRGLKTQLTPSATA